MNNPKKERISPVGLKPWSFEYMVGYLSHTNKKNWKNYPRYDSNSGNLPLQFVALLIKLAKLFILESRRSIRN